MAPILSQLPRTIVPTPTTGAGPARAAPMNLTPTLVWLPADHRAVPEDGQDVPFVVLAERYAQAVLDGVQAQPVLFPMAAGAAVEPLLALVDGVMLTGSPSNVHPSHYGQDVLDPSLPLDPQRDAQTLALVRACVALGVPLLGICRGFQEINVALGGSLHQAVHRLPGFQDHRDPPGEPEERQFGLAHRVRLRAGSPLRTWCDEDEPRVNTLHGQGVDRLADGLRVEAVAPDGLVEAFTVEGARSFAAAVQWHPEWRCMEYPFYAALFRAFGDACRERWGRRLQAAQDGRREP